MAAPVINITNSPGLTLIDDAESTTGWAGFNDGSGGTPGVVGTTEVFIQNATSNSAKISGSSQNKGIWFDVGGTTIDMTTTGRHLYMWIQCTTPGNLNAIASGGIYIKIASDASGNNWNKYFVDGIDTYPGGWVRYVIDVNKTPSETAATAATLSTIRWFGAGLKQTGSSVAENLYVDRMDYGDGLQIEDGDSTTPASWQELFEEDDAVANKYGIITKKAGVFFVKGGLAIGDASSTATTLWDDASGSVVVFEDPQYYNGTALVSAVDAASLYNIDLVGNGTGTTDITFGDVVGSGDSRQGIGGGAIRTAGPPFAIDGETDIADLDTVNLYGMSLTGAGTIQLSGSTKTDAIGCTFTSCDEIQPNDAEFLNNTIVAPQPDRGVEMLSSHTMKQLGFVAGGTDDRAVVRAWQVDISATPDAFVEMTDEANDATVNNLVFFPATEAAGDYCAFGSRQKFAKLVVDVGTAGVGGTVIWRYWSGSGWTTLSGVTDGTTNLTTTGPQDVTYTIPTDWAATSLNGETPLFYITAEVATTYSTNPLGDEGSIGDPIEHHIHFPAAVTVTADAMNFFGFGASGAPKWHGENSGTSAATTINATNLADPVAAEFENTDSGSVTVNNSATLTVTNVRTNSEVRIYDAGTTTEVSTGAEREDIEGNLTRVVQILDGGSGYTVSDVLTVAGGTVAGGGTASQVTVDTVASGVITAVSITERGDYSTDPATENSPTGGTGSGAQFELEFTGDFGFTYDTASQGPIDIVVHHLDFVYLKFTNIAVPSSDSNFPVFQTDDINFENP